MIVTVVTELNDDEDWVELVVVPIGVWDEVDIPAVKEGVDDIFDLLELLELIVVEEVEDNDELQGGSIVEPPAVVVGVDEMLILEDDSELVVAKDPALPVCEKIASADTRETKIANDRTTTTIACLFLGAARNR